MQWLINGHKKINEVKILSKYKDYYDYLSGIWGVDPKLVLDRREFKHPEFFAHHPEVIQLYVCGKLIEGFWDGENFYFGEALSKFGEIKKPHSWFFSRAEHGKGRYVEFYFQPNTNIPLARNERYQILVESVDDYKKYNLAQNCPILMNNRYSRDGFYRYPILSKMNVSSILKPEVIYQMLVDWFSERNNELEKRPDNQTDVQKLVSKGFDKKHSFRKT